MYVPCARSRSAITPPRPVPSHSTPPCSLPIPPHPTPRDGKRCTGYMITPLWQVSGRFALTAGENIGAGDASEFCNRQLWGRAAGLSGADAIVDALPLGYDTLLEDGGGPATAAGGGGGGGEGAMGR